MRLTKERPELNVLWVVFSAEGSRATEARASARAFLDRAHRHKIVVKDFRTSFFPYRGEAIKDYFEQLKSSFQPDLIFTHHREDRHQDHRVLSDLAWNTFRDHMILEYEVPKYDGDLGRPNFFVHLNEATCRKKSKLLVQHFQSQSNKHWFTEDTFLALLRLRGVESAAPGKYAEAFYCRKVVL